MLAVDIIQPPQELAIPSKRTTNLEARAALLSKARNNQGLQAALRQKCAQDALYWLNHFCWIYEPRNELQTLHGSTSPHLPFITYDYQDKLILDYISHIASGSDLINEKSRDMGVTWLVLATLLHFWQFGGPGNDFLIGSRKESLVDGLASGMTPLFPKLRYLINRQPAWLRPNGYNKRKHEPFLSILNPENGNSITGESNNPYFSTSGRYKAILFDEFGKWHSTDAQAWQAASDASPCKIAVSSANGKNNHFYKLRSGEAGAVDVIRTHWREHPHKGKAWYEREKRRRSPQDLAAEVDIDYSGSITGKAYESYDPDRHVKPVPYQTTEPIYLMADFNISPMCWALAHIYSTSSDLLGKPDKSQEVAYFFDELVMLQTSTEAAALEFCKRYQHHQNKALHIYGDATGQNRGRQIGLVSDYAVMEKIFKSKGWRIARYVPRSNPPVSNRIKAMNKRLADWEFPDDQGVGKSWIVIDPKCRMIQRSLEETRRKAEGIDKTDNIDHMADGIGYWADKKHPVISRAISYEPSW